jgi:methionyl-tRNA formyltransferase
MRIVLITGDSLGHRYVANKLAAQFKLAGIVVDHGVTGGRSRRLWKRYTIGQFFSRAVLKVLASVRQDGMHQRERLLETLGAENCKNFLFPELLSPVHGVNSKESVRILSKLQPDVLLIFGTSVVKQPILSLARKVALNLHSGISPYYRGADCAFWPLHNNELHMLGATIHECTMQLDGGRIFATGHAVLQAEDDLYSAFARCLIVGADLYVKVVNDLIAGRLEGHPQDLSVGREYKAVMRNVRADLKVRRQIKNGLIRRYVLTQGNNQTKEAMLDVTTARS